MASHINPQESPQQFCEVDKSSSDQMNQPIPDAAIAEQQKYLLDRYWSYRGQQMAATEPDLKKHEFPLARIKKIMRADQDVRMISADAPVLLSKACEFFIQELMIKSWLRAEHRGRQILRKEDMVEAIYNEPEYYDFLFDEQPDGTRTIYSYHADSGVVAGEEQMNDADGGEENAEMSGEEQMNDVDAAGIQDAMDVDDGANN